MLEGYEKVLGELHPDTLTSVSNLAAVLQKQGMFEAAESANRRALIGFTEVLGEAHPNTLLCQKNLDKLLREFQEFKGVGTGAL